MNSKINLILLFTACLLAAPLLLNLIPVSASNSPEECAVDTSEYTEAGLKTRVSIFTKESKYYKKIYSSTLKTNGFEDKAELTDNTLVKFNIGGCNHYAFSFEFHNSSFKIFNKSEAIDKVSHLVKNLVVTDNDFIETFTVALEKARADKVEDMNSTIPGHYELPCGDASCFIKSEKGVLTIGYDQAI